MNISAEDLEEKCEEFKRVEGRASFYDIAAEIADEHPLQASVVILATWNIGRFRFFMSDSQNLVELKEAIERCKPLFGKIKDTNFATANFDRIGTIVEDLYETFSKIKGVEYTGTSKVMHLFNRNLFVIWDGNIRKAYSLGNDAEDYLKFQRLMQKKFHNIEWHETSKTLAKAIDEYNYMTITFPKLKGRRK